MSNTIKIKRGKSVPTTSDLSEYELGYDTSGKKLYINDNGEIRKAGGGGGFVMGTTHPDDHEMLWIDTRDSHSVMKYWVDDGTDDGSWVPVQAVWG